MLADKNTVGCRSRITQKSPFKDWNEHIPLLTLNKNCSRPSLLLWNILLTRPIKTTIAKYTRELPFPTLPVKEAVNQQAMASTLSSLGKDVSNVDTSKHLFEKTWKLTAILALRSTMHTFIAADSCGFKYKHNKQGEHLYYAYLVMEQVRELVWFVSHHLPLGRQATSLTYWQELGTAHHDSLSLLDKHWWEM